MVLCSILCICAHPIYSIFSARYCKNGYKIDIMVQAPSLIVIIISLILNVQFCVIGSMNHLIVYKLAYF